MTNILHYSQSLPPQTTPNLLSCITSILPISRPTSLPYPQLCSPSWILCTSCPKTSPFPHQNPLFLWHVFARCCKDPTFIIRFPYSLLQYLLSQVLSIHSTKLYVCLSSCLHCQPWHVLPQGGNICSNTQPLEVKERLLTKKIQTL